jgi:integrase
MIKTPSAHDSVTYVLPIGPSDVNLAVEKCNLRERKMANLTDIEIRKTKPVDGRQIELWDGKIKGFGLRISPKGTKSFVLLYRADGRLRRLTLGRYPTLKLVEARRLADEALRSVRFGKDPVAEKKAARKGVENFNFDAIAVFFVENYAKRKTRSWAETERILKKEFIARWGKRDIRTIKRSDVNAVLDSLMKDGKHIMANRALAAVRRLFNWAVERGYLKEAPTSNIKAPARERSRDRVLSDGELQSIWASADEISYPYGEIVKLLVLTGQRLGEVRGMRWDEIDFKERVWSISSERTKAGRAHEVPLVNQAMEIVRNLPRLHEELLFPARKHGTSNPVSGMSKWKAHLDHISGVTDWRIHDLRRTVATGMARSGVPPHVVERILNHRTGTFRGVAGVYNRFGYLPEMRGALELWAVHVMQLQTAK